ncbi:MAG: hypothetical protein ACHQ01_01485 [Candidatus Limnocylindrales bacterium]
MHRWNRSAILTSGAWMLALAVFFAACAPAVGSLVGSSDSAASVFPEGSVASQTGAPMSGSTAVPTATAAAATPPPPTPVPPTPLPPAPTQVATSASPCYVFPASNVWNRDVSGLPVASNSAAMVAAIGLSAYLHPDFDAIGDGIPYNIVTSSTPTYSLAFDYADESDPGPYPIASSPKIEAGSDRHLISIDVTRCKLWELYDVRKTGSGWAAGSGAVFDLRSNALRPAGWTSADAAGLPIFPGLVRYDEVLTGAIRHAIRFTAPATCGYIYPARHLTAAPCSNLPPMGLRLRLKASVDISSFGPHARIVLTALKRYGMILADNGSPWYISGAPDSRWNDDEMHQLQNLTGADFEVVDTSSLRNG